MDTRDQFEQVNLFFADNRLITIPEKASVPFMPTVEVAGISGKEFAHEGSKPSFAAFEQDMCLIEHQGPCIDTGSGTCRRFAHSQNKGITISIVGDDNLFFNTSHNDMVQGTRCIQPRASWHNGKRGYCESNKPVFMGTSKNLLRNLIAALVPKAFGIEILIPTCRDSGFCAPSAFPDMSGCS
jgi:hypothetical protein